MPIKETVGKICLESMKRLYKLIMLKERKKEQEEERS
jgi:hypothetical protein